MPSAEQWIELKKLMNPMRPASEAQYLEPPRSVAEDIAEEIHSSPELSPKFLLLGPTGGGKSSELRAIGRAIGDSRVRVEIDLDASGLNAASLAAADLMYIAGIGLLRMVPQAQRGPLFASLQEAYSGPDTDASLLGTVDEALRSLAGFLDATGAVVHVGEVAAGSPPIIGAGIRAGATVLRLFTDRTGVVAESSPRGAGLQGAVAAIHEAAVEAQDNRSLCLLVDGLEKMNGQAGERFRQVFEQTRLLVNLPCATVFAAPACMLTESNAARSLGWTTRTVWAFAEEPARIAELLGQRFELAGLDPQACVEQGGLDLLARESGGMPRYALTMAARCTDLARRAGAAQISRANVEQAADELGLELFQGLTDKDFELLARVASGGRLPEEGRAARLFSDGRILALPPRAKGTPPAFAVHPLLLSAVRPKVPA